MKVELEFRHNSILMEDMKIIIEGPPARVNEVVEAIRAKAKTWEYWEEE